MKDGNRQTLFEFIQSPQVTALVSAMGLLVLFANVWLVAKLAPLAASINRLEIRADSTDSALIQFIPRGEVELNLTPIREDISEIKSDVKEIKAAINRL